jgi:hypothetical protein
MAVRYCEWFSAWLLEGETPSNWWTPLLSSGGSHEALIRSHYSWPEAVPHCDN